VRVVIDVVNVMAAYFDCNKRFYLDCADRFKNRMLSTDIILNNYKSQNRTYPVMRVSVHRAERYCAKGSVVGHVVCGQVGIVN